MKPVGPPRVDAEIFHRRMDVGRNHAILVGARGDDGLVDCIVKLDALVENKGVLPLPSLCEWLAAAMAAQLGVVAAPAYEVMISEAFAQALNDEELRMAAMQSIGSTFGSGFVPPPTTQWTASLPDPALREPAATLLAFDAFIHNPDRRAIEKSANLLVAREHLVAFDHGDAFSFLFTLFGPDPAVDPLLDMLEAHALRDWIRRRGQRLDRFRVSLSNLTDEVLSQIADLTPKSWQGGYAVGKLDTILDVIRRRRDAALNNKNSATADWLGKVEVWLQK